MTDRQRVAILRMALVEITGKAQRCEPGETLDPDWLRRVGGAALGQTGPASEGQR